MRLFIVLLLVCLVPMLATGATIPPKVADENAKIATDDWYGSLSLRTGYLHNHNTDEMSLCAMAPILGWKSANLEVGAGQSGEVFAALTYDMGDLNDLGIHCFLSDTINLHIGLYAGRRMGINEVAGAVPEHFIWGALATIVNLNADERGNAKAQQER